MWKTMLLNISTGAYMYITLLLTVEGSQFRSIEEGNGEKGIKCPSQSWFVNRATATCVGERSRGMSFSKSSRMAGANQAGASSRRR